MERMRKPQTSNPNLKSWNSKIRKKSARRRWHPNCQLITSRARAVNPPSPLYKDVSANLAAHYDPIRRPTRLPTAPLVNTWTKYIYIYIPKNFAISTDRFSVLWLLIDFWDIRGLNSLSEVLWKSAKWDFN